MAYGVNAPFGLQPRQYKDGSLWTGQAGEYQIASGYATSIFTGDPVTQLANGTIGIGVAGAAITGVFIGCKYFDLSNTLVSSPYWPANTATFQNSTATAFVVDDENVLFDIQTNGGQMTVSGGYGIVLADQFSNFNFVAGAGSTFSGQSGFMVNNTTQATTATHNLKLVRLTPRPGNQYGAGTLASPNYNNGLFLINNHQYKGGTGTAGV